MKVGDRVKVGPNQINLRKRVGNREGIVTMWSGETITVVMCDDMEHISGFFPSRWQVVEPVAPTQVYLFQEGIMLEEADGVCYVPFSELRTVSHRSINQKINIDKDIYAQVLALWKENTI